MTAWSSLAAKLGSYLSLGLGRHGRPFETSTLAISVFDQHLRYTATNPAFQVVLGYTDEGLRQLTPLDLTVEGERETADSRLAALREGKIDNYVIEKQFVRMAR